MHALIIEDNALITLAIADELRDRGFDSIVCADTCEQAIAFAAEQCPDLITADHWLASQSGIDAVRKICEDRPIPVIFIVALLDDRLKEMPNAFVLQKPFSSADLAAAIVAVMPDDFRPKEGPNPAQRLSAA